jgi:hypothetical protein
MALFTRRYRVRKTRISSFYVERDDIDLHKYREEFFASKKAAIIYTSEEVEIVKMRLDVAYLGRNDKARIVFVVVKTKSSVIFIELYAKNDKDREDTSRYKGYIK